jgi:acyl-CoA reductase-like NAD-dependent aldehyde dehydrogenase
MKHPGVGSVATNNKMLLTSDIMKTSKIYVAGQFRESEKTTEVRNPHNFNLVGIACMGSEKDLDDAIEGAEKVLPAIKALPSYKRYEALMFISNSLVHEKQKLAEILAGEAAKPIKLALGEIDRAAETFRIAAEESLRLPKEYISLDRSKSGEGKGGLVKYFPVGIVAGISPFNFPMNLAVHKIAPAIAAGCPIILKPSTSTPLSTLELAQIIDQAELPAGAVSIIPMDRKTGNRMVSDPRIKLLSFTGSPEVGWKMKAAAGKKKVVLELGGNAGLIVSGSADLNHAVERCVAGGFAYAGQVCIHTQRIFVHHSVFQQFSEKFSTAVSQLKYGDPLDPATDITSMIDEANAIRVEEWVNEAIEGGAKLVCGGSRTRAYYAPTVLTGTQTSMKVCALEVFGPVVVLEPYGDFEEAVAMINHSRYGLQAGAFTDSISEMNYAFEHLEVGGVIINDVPTFRADNMPYGGVKDSGIGREGVRYAIMEMMEPRVLVKNF